MTISPTSTVAELVLERPARSRLFEQLRIDYCCGGKRTLAEACEKRGLDVAAVLAVLASDDWSGPVDDVSSLGVPELCDHIVDVHHARLREELPRLSQLWAKVERAHGAEHPEVLPVRESFEALRSELETHIEEEERELFPAARTAAGGGPVAGSLLAGLEDDHEHAGELLERLSGLTGGYDLERAQCNTHRAALDGLRELELDLHAHIHEENNILFPRLEALRA